jgi:hypothetical protein
MAENKNNAESFLLEAISHYNALRTRKSLGDRRNYVGASDIASAFGCERRVLLDKFGGAEESRTPESTFVLERGHWVEQGLGEAIAARVRHTIFGLSITGMTEGGTPISIHPDIVCVCKTKILVFEVKSVGTIPAMVRTEHQSQLHIQMGVMAKMWSKNAFTTPWNREHPCSFPELLKGRFGLEGVGNEPLPIEGYVVYVSNKALRVSPPQHIQESILEVLLNKADRIWALRSTPEQGMVAKGIYPLCDYCAHCSGCPAFKSTDVPELAATIQKYKEAAALLDAAKANKEIIAEELKTYGSKPAYIGKWLTAGGDKVKVSHVNGRATLDTDKLVELLVQRGFSFDAALDLLDAATGQSGGYLRLTLSKAKADAGEGKSKAKPKAEAKAEAKAA